jgi:hypothetical protein
MAGQWQIVISTQAIPLLKWSHVAATYDPAGVMSVFINGQLGGSRNVTGNPSPSREDLWIGVSHTKPWPALTEREVSKTPTPMVFDGLMHEVKLHGEALGSNAILAVFQAAVPKNLKPLQYRKMLSRPDGPGSFGACYARLNYCEEWDRLWRVAGHPDIAVRFDESPKKLVFWRKFEPDSPQ